MKAAYFGAFLALCLLVGLSSSAGTSNTVNTISINNGTLTISIVGLPAGIQSSIQTNQYETYYYENHFNYTNTNTTPYYAIYHKNFTTTAGVTTVTISNVIANYTPILISASAIYGAQEDANGNQYVACSATYASSKCYNYTNPSTAKWNGVVSMKFWTYLNITQFDGQEASDLEGMGITANSPIIIGLIGNITNSSTYGNVKVNGNYTAAGQQAHYAKYNSTSGSLNFVNTSVVQATPDCQVNLNGVSYSLTSQNRTEPYPLAIVNGHIGFTNATSTTLAGSLVCNNHNPLAMAYIIQNGGSIISSGNTTATTLNQPFSFVYKVGTSLNIAMSVNGNHNYTVAFDPFTPPAPILHYANNTLSSAANTFQLMIPVNTLKYSSYINNNANNIEFFYPNGTVVYSWMEGNVLNEQQTTAMNTIANDIFWVKLNPSASGTVNVISMGFAGISNILLNGIQVGEAPQLSPTYAEYDNGASVFNIYDNFAGTTLNAIWNKGIGLNYTVANGLTLNGQVATGPAWSSPGIALNSAVTGNNVFDIYSTEVIYDDGSGWSTTNDVSTTEYSLYAFSPATGSSLSAYPNFYYQATSGSAPTAVAWSDTLLASIYYVFSVSYLSPGTVTPYLNYKAETATQTAYSLTSVYPFIAACGNGASCSGSKEVYWAKVRTAPPSGIMPAVTFSPVLPNYTPLTVSVTTSNTYVDVGEYETITANVVAGTAPYTYNIIVSNSITKTPIRSQQTTNSLLSQAYTFLITATDLLNKIQSANVILTDSNPTTVNSPYSANIYIDPALGAGQVIPYNVPIDSGQTITLTSNAYSGTTPYTYQWYKGTNPTCSLNSAISLATSSTYNANSTSTEGYCYEVTDSATVPETNYSSLSTITVYNAPTGFLYFLPSGSNQYDANGVITVNEVTFNGIGPFTFYFTQNSVSVPTTSFNTFGTYAIQPGGIAVGNYLFNAIATDTGAYSGFNAPLVSNTLTITKATPFLSLSVSSSTGIVDYSITTYNSQLSACIYTLGIPEGCTTSNNTYNLPVAGTYSIVLNTTGNGNYLSNDNSTIVDYQPGGGGGGGGGGGSPPTTTTIPQLPLNATPTSTQLLSFNIPGTAAFIAWINTFYQAAYIWENITFPLWLIMAAAFILGGFGLGYKRDRYKPNFFYDNYLVVIGIGIAIIAIYLVGVYYLTPAVA